MSNPYYTSSGKPNPVSLGVSSEIRDQFSGIEGGFDKLPALGSNTWLRANAGGTALSQSAYKTGAPVTVTPVFDFETHGNLAVTVFLATMTSIEFGPFIFLEFALTFTAFTHTTASGRAFVTGMPVVPAGSSTEVYTGEFQGQGMTTSFTQGSTYVVGGTSRIYFSKCAPSQTPSFMDTTNIASGGTPLFRGTLLYRFRD